MGSINKVDAPSRDWQHIVTEKRRQQQEVIDGFATTYRISNYGQITDAEKRIAEHDDTSGLSRLIATGELKTEAVVRDFIASLTEVFFPAAIQRAKELDNYLLENGRTFGPMHGIPMTVKDQFDVEGYDSTLGYTSRAHSPASENSVLVKLLKSLGAIVIAKTNLPQSIMWCETENPLWGLTTNPINRDYTPGGSTGGEAALLFMSGSMLGWGTDIGGSIRIPSHMMGLYGLKPSSSRLPYFGVPVSTEGQEHVPSSVGPLSRTMSSIYQVMRELILLEPWTKDSRCTPIPWREKLYDEFTTRKLTIGILRDDGVVRPHPPITRALERAAMALKEAGHELLDWSEDLHAECISVMDAFYTADGGEDIRRDVQAGGEPFLPHVENLVNRGKAISVYDYWQLNKRKISLQQAYLEKWDATKSPRTGKIVDALLMPVMPHTAVPHRACRWVGYTKVWNLLDYTSLSIPAGKVEAHDCMEQWNYASRNDLDDWNATLWKAHNKEMADMGLPVGVQIVGRKLEEEKVLAIGKVLDDLLRAYL